MYAKFPNVEWFLRGLCPDTGRGIPEARVYLRHIENSQRQRAAYNRLPFSCFPYTARRRPIQGFGFSAGGGGGGLIAFSSFVARSVRPVATLCMAATSGVKSTPGVVMTVTALSTFVPRSVRPWFTVVSPASIAAFCSAKVTLNTSSFLRSWA